MTNNERMMKKRAREGWLCDNRHCPSTMDSQMSWYDKGVQRSRERRAWMREIERPDQDD